MALNSKIKLIKTDKEYKEYEENLPDFIAKELYFNNQEVFGMWNDGNIYVRKNFNSTKLEKEIENISHKYFKLDGKYVGFSVRLDDTSCVPTATLCYNFFDGKKYYEESFGEYYSVSLMQQSMDFTDGRETEK